jgi:hypothetical protein
MPTATQTHTTPTRRSALAFSTAAIVAGLATPVLASAPDPDAELIAICAEAISCEARVRHIDQHEVSDDDCADATNTWDKVYKQVADTPATNLRASLQRPRFSIWRSSARRSGAMGSINT